MSDEYDPYVEGLLEEIAERTAERDRARDFAAGLEAQVAKVAEIHSHQAEQGGHHGWCWCGDRWPCDTARAIGVDE